MPCVHVIIPEYRLIWNRPSGALTANEVFALSEAIRKDPDFDPGFAILQDFRNLERDELGFVDMVRITSEIAAFRRTQTEPLRCAFVAPGDVAFSMARMFQTLMQNSGNAEIDVARSCDEAVSFLGLPEPARAMVRDERYPSGRSKLPLTLRQS